MIRVFLKSDSEERDDSIVASLDDSRYSVVADDKRRSLQTKLLALIGQTTVARSSKFILAQFASIGVLAFLLGCGHSAVVKPVVDEVPDPNQSSRRAVKFSEVASERGLNYSWPQQPRPMRSPEAFGCGCAAFDFNNDGWQDVLLVADPFPHLFQNDGSGHFIDVTDESGLQTLHADWTGCAIGDYDGDGLLDILLTGFHQLALLKNRSAGHFEDVTHNAGLDSQNHNKWGASAGFMDLDRDGWLDLVVLNYVQFGPDSKQYCELHPGVKSGCPPQEYPPERGEIWRNNQRGGFELVPEDLGMRSTSGVGLVLAFTDLDGDQLMDFYIGNDGVPADLMHNLGEMKFENLGVSSGLALGLDATPMAAMGADWSDFDRDGRLDLAVSNFDKRSFSIFRNEGGQFFSDVAHRTGVTALTRARLGFGANWIDFDNDGWSDLVFVNGHVYDNVHELDSHATYRQPTLLLFNEEGRRFVDMTPQMPTAVARPMVGRGSASVDFDNDGSVDFLAVDFEGTPYLLHNETRSGKSWITIDLRAKSPNHFCYGARLVGKSGTNSWVEQVSPSSSYLSSKDLRVHWGLGDVKQLDSLTIQWPSGKESIRHNVPVNQILQIDEGL